MLIYIQRRCSIWGSFTRIRYFVSNLNNFNCALQNNNDGRLSLYFLSILKFTLRIQLRGYQYALNRLNEYLISLVSYFSFPIILVNIFLLRLTKGYWRTNSYLLLNILQLFELYILVLWKHIYIIEMRFVKTIHYM